MMLLAMLIAAADIHCDARALMKTMSATPQISCTYRQLKESTMFKQRLTSEGRLWSTQDGRFRIDTEKPAPSSLRITKGRATLTANGKTEQLPLDKLPAAQTFLNAFSRVFVGEFGALEKVMQVSARCEGKSPSLTLAPKDASLRAIEKVDVAIVDARVASIEIVERNGDRSEIMLLACDRASIPAETFSAP